MQLFKNLFGRIVMGIVACMVIVSGTAFAAEQDIAYVKEVLTKNQDLSSGQTWMNITLLSPVAKAKVELNSKDIIKPDVFCKGEMITNLSAIWGYKQEIKMPFYMEKVDDNPVVYWQYDGKWYKIFDIAHTKKMDSLIETAMLSQLSPDSPIIKSADIVFDNNIQRRVNVVLDGKAIGALLLEITDIIDQQAKSAPKDDKAKGAEMEAKEAAKFLYSSLGDMPLELTVDAATMRITALKADVSPTLRKVIVAAVDQYYPVANADQKEMLDRLLNSCTLTVDAVYTMHNNVAAEMVAVPADVKAAAQDFLSAAKTAELPTGIVK